MKTLSRREFLKMTAVGTAGAILAACKPAAAPTEAPKGEEPKAVEPTQQPPKGKPIKITMVESWFGVPQFKESIDPVTQAISEKMQSEGLNIEIQSMVLDDHQSKYTVLYASGADFTMAFDAPWYKMNSLRDQGALEAIEGLIEEHGPKLKEEITEKIYNANFMMGHLYGIPTGYYYSGTSGVILREDLRKKYGAPEPSSAEGWASVTPYLEAIKKNEPSMMPFANLTAYSMIDFNFWLRRSWLRNYGLVIPDFSKGTQLVPFEEIPEFKEAVSLLRSWWEQDLVNKTDLPGSGPSQNVQVDYLYPGKTASCVENEPEYKYVEQTKQLKASIPEGELMGWDVTGMRAGKVKGLGALKQWNFIVFNATAPQEQKMAGIQYFNWLASSQDNIDLWLMGIEGKNYKKEPNLRFSEIPGVDAARNYRRMWYVSGISGRFQRQPVDLPKVAEEALAFFSTESNWDFNPYEQFEIDTKAVEVEASQLDAVWAEAWHGVATGQLPVDESIAKFTKILDDAGRQVYREKVQKQLDDFIAAMK